MISRAYFYPSFFSFPAYLYRQTDRRTPDKSAADVWDHPAPNHTCHTDKAAHPPAFWHRIPYRNGPCSQSRRKNISTRSHSAQDASARIPHKSFRYFAFHTQDISNPDLPVHSVSAASAAWTAAAPHLHRRHFVPYSYLQKP